MEGEYPYKIISYMIVIRNRREKLYSELEERLFREKSQEAFERQQRTKQIQLDQEKTNHLMNDLSEAGKKKSSIGSTPKANNIVLGEAPKHNILGGDTSDWFKAVEQTKKPTLSTPPSLPTTPPPAPNISTPKPAPQLSQGSMGARTNITGSIGGPQGLTYGLNVKSSSPSLEIKPLNHANPGTPPVISPTTASKTAAQKGAAWGKAMRPALTAATIGTLGLLAYNHFKNKDSD